MSHHSKILWVKSAMSTSLHETLIPWTCLNINIVIVVNYLSRIMTIATRVRQEIYLIRYYWWRLLLTIAFMFYMCLVVSRNVAFMRHYKISHYVTNENASFVRIWILEDIGFQIIPNWSHNKLAKDFNEIINAALIASIGVFCIVTLFLEKARVQKIFATNVVVRFVYCYTTMNILRPFVYLPTSLPGSASHCTNATITDETKPKNVYEVFTSWWLHWCNEMLIRGNLWVSIPGSTSHCTNATITDETKPKNVYEVFTSMEYSKNCGDLVYSGHMAGFVSGCCVVIYYTHKLFRCDHTNNNKKRRRWYTSWPTLGIIVLCILGMIAQALLAIGTRQHYTVDIVVGIIVGYWNFIWHLYVLRPNDMEVPVEQSTTRSNNGEINYGITDIKTV